VERDSIRVSFPSFIHQASYQYVLEVQHAFGKQVLVYRDGLNELGL